MSMSMSSGQWHEGYWGVRGSLDTDLPLEIVVGPGGF